MITSNSVGGSSIMPQCLLLINRKKNNLVSPVSPGLSLSKQMTITQIDKAIPGALLIHRKSSKTSAQRCHILPKGVFKCQESMWQIQYPAHYSREAALTLKKGGGLEGGGDQPTQHMDLQ